MSTHPTVDSYIQSIDPIALPIFNKIRYYILSLNDQIQEYSGYGILGFKLGKKKFYIGGYKTHIGLYPGPTLINSLKDELKDLKVSKGTIHIPLKEPIPFDVIKLVIQRALDL